MKVPLLLLPLLLLQALSLPAQEPGPGKSKKPHKKTKAIQPYDKVITKEAHSDPGLFLVHRVGKKLLYEIAPSLLGKEMLWVTQIAATQAGSGYGGTPVGHRVVRWEIRDKEILLRDVKHTIRASHGGDVENAVKATSLEPIIKVFPIKAWGKDKAAVIDVTDLFLGDTKEFSPKRRLGASSLDRKRSFLDKVRSFPRNIEVQVLATYKPKSPSSSTGRRRFPRSGPRRDSSQSGITVLVHHSMVALPETLMRPRLADDRVGFFSVSFQDYGQDAHQVKEVRYITRWRLEKKDPSAALSEPKQPIVFYVGRGVPARWRPWIKKGIEMWQPAFEAAGFKHAIIAKDPPSPHVDPDWDAEDARYSTIRWLPSTIENAMGPHVSDPRTGEILDADILVYHNVIKLIRDWYFVQASPNDPAAQTLPMPDSLIGRCLAYVIAHEVGHSLGFPHNMKASSSFSVAQLRDPKFTHKWGTEASIMDYGRFNYVAQPGDGAALIPKVGIYDRFAVEWGYREFKGAATPEQEKKLLAPIVARQIKNPFLRFGGPNAAQDPSQQTEDLGSNSLAATRLGLLNIKRVAGYLIKATCKPGKDYSLLRNMYQELLSQRMRELSHVAALIGGSKETNLWYGDRNRRFQTVSPALQKESVAFLLEKGFQTPRELLSPDILGKLEANGAAARILGGHKRLLRQIVNENRVDRMAEQAELDGGEAYLPVQMLTDLRQGIWSELRQKRIAINLFRRQLQRAFVQTLSTELGKKSSASDLPALCRGQLKILSSTIDRINPSQVANETTLLHLRDTLERIKEALDPRGALERSRRPGSSSSQIDSAQGRSSASGRD